MQDLSRRNFLKTTAAVGLGAAAGIGFPAVLRAQGAGTVKVGVLHSLSGTMAISEVSLRDVCMMANGVARAACRRAGRARRAFRGR